MSTPIAGGQVSHQVAERAFQVQVERRVELASGVIGLRLVSPHGHDLPHWQAGAHIDLMLANGLVRQYSLCGEPTDRRGYEIAVLVEQKSRGGSAFIHDSVAEGDLLEIRGPRNHFELVDAASYLFIAGGIGVTPIRPMISTIAGTERSWRLVYGGRSRQTMAFLDDIARWPNDSVEILPEEDAGLLPLRRILTGLDAATVVYCCGPEPLLAAVEAECGRQTISNLRVERFTAKPLSGDHPTGSFEIQLARSEEILTIGEDESILDVLEQAGIPIDSSCRDGTCGSCETGVLEGDPDHRDSILSPAEQEAGETMMVCVSRCRGRKLVLDL